MPAGRTMVKSLLVLVGVVATVFLISTAFFRWELHGGAIQLVPRFSLEEFFRNLPSHLPWLAAFSALSASVLVFRAVQWRFTLRKRVPLKERYHIVAIGAFAMNALPGKLGDVIRAFLMARSQRLPFVETLGSVAVCKLLEFAALMLLVAVSFFGPFAGTMHQFDHALRIAVMVCLTLVLAVVLLAHYAQPLARKLQSRGRLPRVQRTLLHVSEGLGTARSFRGMAVALVASIPPVLAPALGYGLGLAGMGVHGGVFAGVVVLGAIALGQSLPGVPVGMGLYYFVTSWAARSLGATEGDAAAYAVLTHLGTVLTQVTVGGVSVAVRRFNWRELRRRGNLAADIARQELTGPDAAASA